MRDLIRKVILEYTDEVTEASRFKSFDMNDESFARLFSFFITELKNNTGFSHSKMKRAFVLTIRKWTEKPPQIISKKVLDHFIENHPNVNPFKVSHRPRNRFGIEVIFEHTTPVNIFVTQLFKAKSFEEIKDAMNNYTGMSIITRDEDYCLHRSGFSRTRPDGWMSAYAACDIEIMTEDEFNRYKSEKLNSLDL
jgi:hypothetical protein